MYSILYIYIMYSNIYIMYSILYIYIYIMYSIYYMYIIHNIDIDIDIYYV